TFLIRTTQPLKGITYSYELRITQTWQRWKYHPKRFSTISRSTHNSS
ncbi:hypothetical protein MTR67_012971, partial [Solanum verrucosum]